MAWHCLDNGLQPQAAGYIRHMLFPADQNLGRSGRYRSWTCFTMCSPLSIAHHHVVHITCLNWIFTICLSVKKLSCHQTSAPAQSSWSRKVFSVLLIVKMPWYKMLFMIMLSVLRYPTLLMYMYLDEKDIYTDYFIVILPFIGLFSVLLIIPLW